MNSVSVSDYFGRWFRYSHPVNHRTCLLYVVRSVKHYYSSSALCLIIDSSFGFVDLRWCRFDPEIRSLTTTLNHVTLSDEISKDSGCIPPPDVVDYYLRKHG